MDLRLVSVKVRPKWGRGRSKAYRGCLDPWSPGEVLPQPGGKPETLCSRQGSQSHSTISRTQKLLSEQSESVSCPRPLRHHLASALCSGQGVPVRWGACLQAPSRSTRQKGGERAVRTPPGSKGMGNTPEGAPGTMGMGHRHQNKQHKAGQTSCQAAQGEGKDSWMLRGVRAEPLEERERLCSVGVKK